MNTKPSEKIMNVKVPEDLKEAFTRTVASQDKNASQVLRDLMRKYVAQHGQVGLL